MIRIMAIDEGMHLLSGLSLKDLAGKGIQWFWVDFAKPAEAEISILSSYFDFHPLAVEDCLHLLERPKLDYYEKYSFLVLHAINQDTLEPEEVDMFIGSNFIVTFHAEHSKEVNEVWSRVCSGGSALAEGPQQVFYQLLDKIVDYYFPAVYRIEDSLDELDAKVKGNWTHSFINRVFELRGDLLLLRRTVNAMRDLVYRIINSNHLAELRKNQVYFTDIYDHLLKLSDMIESNREMTADMRDSYMSINSNRMNNIMMILTVITTIFIPLTFIVGVYGMNFDFMPELRWRYGYFVVLGVMALIAAGMFYWFKKKGWFNTKK